MLIILSPQLSTIPGFTIHTDRIESNRETILVFRRKLSPISDSGFFRWHFRCSTAASDGIASATRKNHVDYPVDSLGFSKEAISASSEYKVKTHLKSTTNADLVVNLLKDYGLSNTQIDELVSSVPRTLKYKADKTLEPKLGVLRELGLSGSDLVKLIKRNPSFIYLGFNLIDYLRKILASDEKAAKVIKKSIWMSSSTKALKRMEANVLLLQNCGISIDKIKDMIVRHPEITQSRTECLEESIRWVEEELGISCSSPMFVHGLELSVRSNNSTLEKKMQIFRSFGWAESELSTLLRAQPLCLTNSEANLRDKLNFFMRDLQHTPLYLTKYPVILMYSLERRVKPRYKIWKILKDKKLVKEKPAFATLVTYIERRFLAFVQRFEHEVPSLCQTYTNSLKNTSKVTSI